MPSSILEQYRIADFLEWHKKKAIELNPHFQRRSVWSPSARIYLIDTVLRRLPMPKVFIRTKIDIKTQRSYREVVDGQQRLRAIFDFAEDRITLSSRANEFSGLTYSTLDADQQEAFLTYPIAVDQLINATDTDVLEVFARLNSYTVSLTAAELRHAKYQGEFKWAVYEASRAWSILWDTFRVVSTTQRVRMVDYSAMAEMLGFFVRGIGDGDQRSIGRLYEEFDRHFPEQQAARTNLDRTLAVVTTTLADAITNSLASLPHFLLVVAAVGHALVGLPPGLFGDDMPRRNGQWLTDPGIAQANLARLAAAIDNDELDGPLGKFVLASKANAHRMASRRVRFPVFCDALLPVPIAAG